MKRVFKGWNIRRSIELTGLLLLLQGAASAQQQVSFSDVTESMKAWGWRISVDDVQVSAYGHGASFADVTGDSIPDLYISSAKRQANGEIPETLYIGQPGGAAYSEEDGKRSCSDSYGMTGTHGISFFDYDNDGDFDLYNATTDDWNRLYRNNGVGYFDTVMTAAHLYKNNIWVETYGYIGYGTRGVVAFDADNDGFMDLLGVNWGPVENAKEVPWVTPAQPNEFYYNNGNGTFTRDDTRGLTTPNNPSYMGTQGVTAADVNNDGWMDIFICHRNYAYLGKDGSGKDLFGPGSIPCPNQLLINDGTGHFKDETTKRGLYDAANDINGATFADFDNDGDLDLFIPPKDISVRKLKVYLNDGNGYFTDISSTVKIDQWGFSSILGDFNNDGFLDLFAARSYDTSVLFLNTGAGNFSQQTNTGVEIKAYDPRGGALADIDHDGDLDIYYVDANKDGVARYSNRLFRNNLKNSNHWLKVTGRGPKGDAGGFGTKIWIFEAGAMDNMQKLVGYRQVMNTYGYLCQDDPVQHFGLGSRSTVDVKVRFLDGTELRMSGVAADRKVIFTRPQQITVHGGDQQSGSGGQLLAKPLQVRVTDTWGKSVRGAAVNWHMLSGDGEITTPVTLTDPDGIASTTCTLGTTTTQQQVQASSPDFSTTAVFTLTNSTPVQAQIVRVSGSGQHADATAELPFPLVARVSQLTGAPVSQYRVIFNVTAGGGKVNGADSAIVLSDPGGLVQVTWRLGAQPGSVQQVKAYLPGLPDQVIYFDATTNGLAAELQWLSTFAYNGVVGKPLVDSLAARIFDAAQHPVGKYPVDFAVTAGDGKVNGATTVRVLTNSQGIAKCQWRLGSQAGGGNQSLRVTAGTLQNSPLTIAATAFADAPYQLGQLSGDAQSAMVNEIFNAPLSVIVSDTFGNPVSGQMVLFEVIQGSASFLGSASAAVTSIANGRAQATLKAGTTTGAITGRISASNAGKPLVNSPLFFSAVTTPLPFDPTRSSLSATSPVTANNRSQSLITVHLRDVNGMSVAGMPVTLYATGANNNLIQPAPTNSTGQATGYLLSTRAEVKKIWATVAGRMVNADSAGVTFLAGPGASLIMVSGDNQTAYTGRVLTAPLVVALADSFENPVQNALIMATLQRPDGTSMELAPQATDIRGYAHFQPAMSSQPGVHTISIRYGTLPAFSFTTQALMTLPRKVVKVSGDGQTGVPGSDLPQLLTLQVLDEFDNPVAGIAVQFAVISGGGNILPAAVQYTDKDGMASEQWTLGAGGAQTLKAWLVNTPALQTQFTAVLAANQAPQLTCPANPTVAEGGTLSFLVTAQDPEGSTVSLSATGLPASAVFDSLSGIFSWNPGYTDAGLYMVTFTGRDQFGGMSSVACHIRVTNVRRPLQILAYSPADTLVVMDLYKAYTLAVTAFDPDGDSLRYQWDFNGLPVGNESMLTITANPTYPAHCRISVRIFTHTASTSLSWTLDIKSGVIVQAGVPDAFVLEQNYPNPFNPTTIIPFQVGHPAQVTLTLYNASGQLIRRLYHDLAGSGRHEVIWDGRDDYGHSVPSGVYCIRMESEAFQQIKKLLLLK